MEWSNCKSLKMAGQTPFLLLAGNNLNLFFKSFYEKKVSPAGLKVAITLYCAYLMMLLTLK